jgi:Fic/DOC family
MAAGRPPREALYQRLDTQITELWERLGGLPSPAEAGPIWRSIWFEEAHHSTALEGNTLVLKQVEQLLAEGRAVGNKQLAEYMEVRGYADAAEWVYGQAIQPRDLHDPNALLTITEVRRVHEMAMQPVWDVTPHPSAGSDKGPGSFRRHDIHPFPGGMVPPLWTLVDAEIAAWLERFAQMGARTPAMPEQIAELHAWFERVHPFLDGNGRTGRLVLNLILVRLGYPPAIIYKTQRPRYLRALQRADGGDPGALGELLARSILDNLYRFIVPALAGPARLVPLAALATPEINAGALRVAANREALQASKASDGTWRSSRHWVDEYLAHRYRRTRDRKNPHARGPQSR